MTEDPPEVTDPDYGTPHEQGYWTDGTPLPPPDPTPPPTPAPDSPPPAPAPDIPAPAPQFEPPPSMAPSPVPAPSMMSPPTFSSPPPMTPPPPARPPMAPPPPAPPPVISMPPPTPPTLPPSMPPPSSFFSAPPIYTPAPPPPPPSGSSGEKRPYEGSGSQIRRDPRRLPDPPRNPRRLPGPPRRIWASKKNRSRSRRRGGSGGGSDKASVIRENQAGGNRTRDDLKKIVERKGHGLKSEVTIKGGKGGSRPDLSPDPNASQSIRRTLESKRLKLDVNEYRTPSGDLKLDALRSRVEKDVDQVLKHEAALREGRKPDLPRRETLVYTVENGKEGEALRFQRFARDVASRRGVTVGVLQKEGNLIKTVSGRLLGEAGFVDAQLAADFINVLKGVGEATLVLLPLLTTEPPPDHPENVLLAPVSDLVDLIGDSLKSLEEEFTQQPGDPPGEGGAEGRKPY
jgi:hypothetical protein